MRVLLVDDEVDEFHLIRRKLDPVDGQACQVEWIGDYDQALEALAGRRFDVALIDYYLGPRDGLELIREAVRRECGIPLILLTGLADREVDLAAMDSGASDFLAKAELTGRTLERALRYAIRQKAVESALRASEAEARKLALVAARTQNAVIITDDRGRIEWVNEGFERITEYRLDEVRGRRPGSILQGPDTDPMTVDFMRRRLEAREGFEVEILNYSKSGRTYWLAIEVRPVVDVEGRLTNFIAIEGDITERRRSEEALRESNREIGRILDRVTDGVFALDLEWRFTYVNPKAEPLLGRSAGGLLGSIFWDAFPETLGTPFEAQYRRSMADGVVVSFEEYYPPLGRWFTVHGYPSAEGLSVYFTDATERIRSGEAIRRSEAQYRLLAENSTDMITRHDPEGRVLYASPAIRPLLGYEPEEAIGRMKYDLIHPMDHAAVRQAHRAILGSDEAIRATHRVLGKDGSWRWLETASRSVRDPGTGEVLEIQCSSRDVGERLSAESEIRRLNERLECRLRRMEALRRIDLAITSELDLRQTLSIVIDQALAHLGVDAASVHLLDARTGTLELAAGRCASRGDSEVVSRPGPLAEEAIREGHGFLADLSSSPLTDAQVLALGDLGFTTYQAVPLLAKGRVNGVIETFRRAVVALDREESDFLETLAGQAAIAIDNARLFEGLRATNARLTQAYDETIEGWARVLDLRDRETEGHSRRVTELTVRLARTLRLGEEEMIHVRRGALLHDIGKMGVPDSILLKPGRLDEEEWALMERHPGLAREMLWPIEFLRPAIDIPYCHHERWDGGGYPRGLEGEEIPHVARIFAVVDIWDALSHDRPYRGAWDQGRVVDYLRSLSGNHLDPEVVRAFLALLGSMNDPADRGTLEIRQDPGGRPLLMSAGHGDLIRRDNLQRPSSRRKVAGEAG